MDDSEVVVRMVVLRALERQMVHRRLLQQALLKVAHLPQVSHQECLQFQIRPLYLKLYQ